MDPKTKAAAAAPAADETAALTGENAAPAHVESGEVAAELGGDDNAEELPFTREEGERTMVELVQLDLRIREHGHTLADILAITAKNVYGVDLR